MKTSLIKKMIEKAVENEQSTNNLAKHVKKAAEQIGQTITMQQAMGVSDFVIEYVKLVPAFIEEGFEASQKFGIQIEMTQMLSELEYYWRLEQDLIPDNLGLIGITDDAYASIFLLQTISDYCMSMYNRPLLKNDFTTANQIIRGLLGIEIATQIEQKVQITIGNNMLNHLFNKAFQNIFSSGFAFGNNMNTYVSESEIDHRVGYLKSVYGL